MLEIRPCCEHCGKDLPPDSTLAMICTFECTFCKSCVEDVLENVCPNCGGGFERRPIRPAAKLRQFPASQKQVFKPVNWENFSKLKEKMKDTEPSTR